MESQDPPKLSKPPLKVRLSQKWASNYEDENPTKAEQVPDEAMIEAYLAGFEKAKALCIDHVARSVDIRIAEPDFEPPYKVASLGRLPSQVLAMIGEDK